jgi:photosystem II stability/assembly factor-like uncharacterized protein
MDRQRRRLSFFLTAALTLAANGLLLAQTSTLYTAVVSTKVFVVGASNLQTGLFYQSTDGETAWHHAGPVNIRAFGVAVGPASRGRVLYVAAGNGLHKSSDAGTTWRITTGWDITEVLWVFPDPVDSNIVFIATPYGVCKTTNGCRTWRYVNRGLEELFCTCVLVDPERRSVVYCASEGGAYRSTNGGESWERMGLSVRGVRTIALHPKDSNTLLAGTENHGLYLSTNAGEWWTKCESGVDHQTFYTIAYDPVNPEVVYAGGYVTGVYKSTDGARSWKRYQEGLPCATIHTIAVDPAEPQRVYAGCYWGGIYRSTDGGEHWSSAGLPEAQVWKMVIEVKR